MIQISKTTDLLKAEPITSHILAFGRNDVEVQISKYVVLCAAGLDIELDNIKMQLLIEDLVDKYKFDSIEDIQQCLKKGRRGDYGPTYGKLNMIIISGWMEKHLEMKSRARENQHDKAKHNFENREQYENAIKVGSKINAEEKAIAKEKKLNEHDYNNYKANYEANKNKIQE